VSLRHAGAKGVRIYSSYSFLASALGAVSGQGHALAVLYPLGKDPRYPLDRRLGGPQLLVWTQLQGNALLVPGIETRLSSLQSDTILTDQTEH
jgi:hypothetical protein